MAGTGAASEPLLHDAAWSTAEESSAARVVVTGHSLGSGVAALLTLLLRVEWPDIRCWALAPPGMHSTRLRRGRVL